MAGPFPELQCSGCGRGIQDGEKVVMVSGGVYNSLEEKISFDEFGWDEVWCMECARKYLADGTR